MDPVTLYAIATMATGEPGVVMHAVPADRCEDYAAYFRHKHPAAIIWCRSEIDPPKPSIGDYIPREKVVEYLPDYLDMRGMPINR